MAKKRKSSPPQEIKKTELTAELVNLGPLYRVTADPEWLNEALATAEHLLQKGSDGSTICITHNQAASLCLPRATDDCVWQSSLDGGRYVVTVTRVAPYKGVLLLVRDERIVLQRIVGLMYNAEFGADGEDIRSWEAMTIVATDEDYRRRGEPVPK